ncbi:MAG: hypothetical protein F6J89_15960 [Symploca sp. SIO1C4]|uniref:Uncharacterized protein n=1 Tax=Symploca sp. SIO1C4 TaxID=2607765 RepID=A0A6B3NEM6_9CYAN|nr:hypothetical protein [Symploca sp. SIO1C4]
MTPQIIATIKELLEAAKPFCSWKAYPESAVLTQAVKKAEQLIITRED